MEDVCITFFSFTLHSFTFFFALIIMQQQNNCDNTYSGAHWSKDATASGMETSCVS